MNNICNDYLYARRQSGKYSALTARSGKWVIHVSEDKIKEIWNIIKNATINGLLGELSKACINSKIIYVYTYDYEDTEDVYNIRKELYNLGINKSVYVNNKNKNK